MKRREFLRLAGAGAAAAALPRLAFSAEQARGDDLNVLFITAEDLRPFMGCYGDTVAHTPNLDRLASRGVRFANAHCQFPLCCPSRSSFLTGCYPETTGVLTNDQHFRETHPDVVALPELFRRHGFHAAYTGKIFHGGYEDERSWDENGNRRKVTTETPFPPERRVKWPDRQNDREEWSKFYKKWSDRSGPDDLAEEHWSDHKTMRRAVDILRQVKDRRFFLAVGFHQTHTPLLAPARYFEHYPLEKIPLPRLYREDLLGWEERPPLLRKGNFDVFIRRSSTPEEARRMIQACYACASQVDDMVGRVLNALEELALDSRTIVVFLADHGFHLGEKGLWSKLTLYEESTRVPFIIAAPGAAPGVSSEPVELLDVYPTLCDLCRLEKPDSLQGTSLLPALEVPGRPRERAAYTIIGHKRVNGRTIRTPRYRYTEWIDGVRELFDHESDPDEATNLLAGGRPEPAATAELKALLEDARRRAAGPDVPTAS